MINAILIFLGAGIGGLLRYGVSTWAYYSLGNRFPYGTLIVNFSGSLLMGLVFTLLLGRISTQDTALRAFLLIGVLGGYTTFSSFSLESFLLIENGEWLSALTNIILSILLCISAIWLGAIAAKQFTTATYNTASSTLDCRPNE